MAKRKKIETVWADLFADPDMVGQSEYRAVYDTLVDAVYNGSVPEDDHVITPAEYIQIVSILGEFHLIALGTLDALKGRP